MDFRRTLLAPLVTLAIAVPGAAQAATAQPYDSAWLQHSIAGDRFEIQAAKLAAKRSRNGHLGALAGRLLSDHTKSLRQATALARRLGVPVATSPTPEMAAVLEMLRVVPQRSFARAYASLAVGGHNQAIVEAGMEVKNGQTKKIQAFADRESTLLAKHLRLARTVLKAL
jgi:putative membrane protein